MGGGGAHGGDGGYGGGGGGGWPLVGISALVSSSGHPAVRIPVFYCHLLQHVAGVAILIRRGIRIAVLCMAIHFNTSSIFFSPYFVVLSVATFSSFDCSDEDHSVWRKKITSYIW